MKKYLLFFLLFIPSFLLASDQDFGQVNEASEIVDDVLELLFAPLISFLSFLFLGEELIISGESYRLSLYNIPIPIIPIWITLGCLFWTIRLKLINIRLFFHSFSLVRGKYSQKNSVGKATSWQGLLTSLATTVNLSNIAGVAIAISIGGVGSVVWIIIAAFFAMSIKFAEVVMGNEYRSFNQAGKLHSGPFYYLEKGLADMNKKKLGMFLAKSSAILCILGMIIGIMFHSNQSIAIISKDISSYNVILSEFTKIIILSSVIVVIFLILLGGLNNIIKIARKIVPFMVIMYIICCLAILAVNYNHLLDSLLLIWNDAFKKEALYGGLIGAVLQGVKRSTSSNEAGLGTSSIIYASIKTKESVQAASVSLLEIFIDTIIITFLTAMVVVVTGSYHTTSQTLEGITIVSNAFATISIWFSYLLSVIILLFSFTTILSYNYYGQQAWRFLTKKESFFISRIVFSLAIFSGGILYLNIIVDFAEILLLSMAVPNIMGLYFLSGKVNKMIKEYIFKLKSGDFDQIHFSTNNK